jgi:hypothetical protein
MPVASPSSTNVPNGQLKPSTTWGEFNNISFVVQQALSKMQTCTLVRVESCTNSGALSAVGFVDITPLVNQIDGDNNPVPHTTIYNVPYLRIQGGTNGIILDPQAGDIGIAVFASRDISKIKSTKAQGNPGSFRQNSFSDALYLGGVLNGVPTQYVQFNASGITIHSPAAVILSAPDIQLNAATIEINGTASTTVTTPTFTVNGNSVLNGTLAQTGGGTANFSGSITATGNVTGQGTSLHTHVHSGVQAGGSNTGAPV